MASSSSSTTTTTSATAEGAFTLRCGSSKLSVSELTEEQRELTTVWKKEQEELKEELVLEDAFEEIRHVAGVDISFSTLDADVAVAGIAILSYPDMRILYSKCNTVRLTVPYIPGFLAFREVLHLQQVILDAMEERPDIRPQIILVDGNGILHPRGFGQACHLGVLSNLPTIGVSKKFFHVDGITKDSIKALLEREPLEVGGFVDLVGDSGAIHGAALRGGDAQNCVYVSPGHRVSHRTAVQLVQRMCKFRQPEPIRAADSITRQEVKKVDKLARSSGDGSREEGHHEGARNGRRRGKERGRKGRGRGRERVGLA